MMYDDDKDQDMKDKILQSLIDHMEDVLGDGVRGRSGLGVEVQAQDPEALKAGLDKAKDVVDQHGGELQSKMSYGGMMKDGGNVQPRPDDTRLDLGKEVTPQSPSLDLNRQNDTRD